jgi:PAS domain-containing protein
LLRAALESSSDGVLVVTANRTIAHCNERFRVMCSIPPDVMPGQSDGVLIQYAQLQLVDPAQFAVRLEEICASSEA